LEEVYIGCTAEVAGPIRAELDAIADGPTDATERSNFDGSVPTWLLVASLAAHVLPHLLTFLATMAGNGRVKKVQIGDVVVENPTEKDLEALRAILAARSAAKADD
jgi:hypothetical protein